ncbi:hypothetical protein [uncultured Desulfobacter sp.]|uniref:hypothetical protein n=1 Tax=uncultured Desulfobacter sp. TaxID=240139 RepID=UPI002AAAA43A|nr:hypothetical protein [uncultured Desulfobacter sp.]
MRNLRLIAFFVLLVLGLPCPVLATQMHGQTEGILVHQVGHFFFLISMVILYITIHRRGLNKKKEWRAFQYSALFFVLWNLDAIIVHFLDNQSGLIRTQIFSVGQIDIKTLSVSHRPALLYYFMRLDHLLCLPGMFFLWRGLSLLLIAHKSDDISGQNPSETALLLKTGTAYKTDTTSAEEKKRPHDTEGIS